VDLPARRSWVSPEVLESKAWKRPRRVAARIAMSGFDQPVKRLPSRAPSLPVWRMHCRCRFRAGKPGEIAACGCGLWWRVSKRGRWYAISKRRAFRALMPGLIGELGYLEVTGRWPAN
jgi:hypothetical protein